MGGHLFTRTPKAADKPSGKEAGKPGRKPGRPAKPKVGTDEHAQGLEEQLMELDEATERDFNRRAVQVLVKTFTDALRPNESITPDTWADKYRLLPSESSAEPGRWRTSRTPYLRGILLELSPDSPRQEIAVCKGAQVGFSEAGLGWLLFLMDVAPGPILCVQPTIELAQRFSKQRVAPSLDKCARLKGKVADKRSRDSSNSLLQKDFTGGTLVIGGANSAVGLRSMPVRNLMLDEVDGYPDDCDGEGDPVVLAVRRTATFRRKKILYGSTPKYEATSRIWPLYADSDQREFHVPCPHCGTRQPITWEAIKWDDGNPDSAHMLCGACGCVIEENHKTEMLAAGDWVAKNPGHQRAGFHLSSLYSPLGWYSWAEAARDYEAAKTDPTKMQTFVNTVLGLPWEEEGESVGAEGLERRCEDYGPADVPAGALLITCAVDVQDRRLEVEFVGWGVGKENWSVEYHVIYGDPAVLVSSDPLRPSVWQELDKLRGRVFTSGDGRRMATSCTLIDSGGHYTTHVYQYCRAREAQRVFALKGIAGQGKPLMGKPSRSNRFRCALFPVGVDTGKELVYARLNLPEPGQPGYSHFPKGRGYDSVYFAGLTSEKRVVRMVQGRPRLYWIKRTSGARNEPLDLRVYATAALELLNVNLDRMAAQLAETRRGEIAANTVADAMKRAGMAGAPRPAANENAPAAETGKAPARVVKRGIRSSGVKI